METVLKTRRTNMSVSNNNMSISHSLSSIFARGENELISRSPLIFALMLMILFGFAMNITVIVVFLKRFPASAIRSYIVTMSVSDLVANTVAIPLHIYTLFNAYDFKSPAICKLYFAMTSLSTNCSSFVVVLFAMDRLRRVRMPVFKELDTVRSYYQVAIVVTLALVVTAPFVPLYGVYSVLPYNPTPIHPRYLQHNPQIPDKLCWIDDSFKDTVYPIVYQAVLGATFVLGLGLMAGSYMKIGFNIHQLAKDIEEELLYRLLHPSPPSILPDIYAEQLQASATVIQAVSFHIQPPSAHLTFAERLHGPRDNLPVLDVEAGPDGKPRKASRLKKISTAVQNFFNPPPEPSSESSSSEDSSFVSRRADASFAKTMRLTSTDAEKMSAIQGKPPPGHIKKQSSAYLLDTSTGSSEVFQHLTIKISQHMDQNVSAKTVNSTMGSEEIPAFTNSGKVNDGIPPLSSVANTRGEDETRRPTLRTEGRPKVRDRQKVSGPAPPSGISFPSHPIRQIMDLVYKHFHRPTPSTVPGMCADRLEAAAVDEVNLEIKPGAVFGERTRTSVKELAVPTSVISQPSGSGSIRVNTSFVKTQHMSTTGNTLSARQEHPSVPPKTMSNAPTEYTSTGTNTSLSRKTPQPVDQNQSADTDGPNTFQNTASNKSLGLNENMPPTNTNQTSTSGLSASAQRPETVPEPVTASGSNQAGALSPSPTTRQTDSMITRPVVTSPDLDREAERSKVTLATTPSATAAPPQTAVSLKRRKKSERKQSEPRRDSFGETMEHLDRIKSKAYMTMTVLTALYVVTWLPNLMTRLIRSEPANYCGEDRECWLNGPSYYICSVYFSSSVNAILYCFGSVHFRKQVKLMYKPCKDKFCKKKPKRRMVRVIRKKVASKPKVKDQPTSPSKLRSAEKLPASPAPAPANADQQSPAGANEQSLADANQQKTSSRVDMIPSAQPPAPRPAAAKKSSASTSQFSSGSSETKKSVAV